MKLFIYQIFSVFILFQVVHAAEKDVYDFSWLDQDKEVYVLQNRKFRKDGRLYVGGTLGRSLAGAFIDSSQMSLQLGYFFNENWGIEGSYTKANGQTNSTHDAVNEQTGGVAFYRKVDTQTNVMLMWSPFYAKINTFNQIYYFDWLFGVGLANIRTLDNRNEFLPQADSSHSDLTEETVTAYAWQTGWRFYLSDAFSLRIDFVATHANVEMAISENETKKRLDSKYNINVGLNFAF